MSQTTGEAIAKQISDRQRQLDISAKALYEHAHISRAAFYRKMKGEVSFTIDDLEKIAAVLNCSIEVLLTPDEHGCR